MAPLTWTIAGCVAVGSALMAHFAPQTYAWRMEWAVAVAVLLAAFSAGIAWSSRHESGPIPPMGTVESQNILVLPEHKAQERAARDFVRFYTNSFPVLFSLSGSPSAYELTPLRPSRPSPHGDFSPSIVDAHCNEFREKLQLMAQRRGLVMSDATFSHLTRYLKVNTLVDLMIQTESLMHLKKPHFVITMRPPRGSDAGCVRVVVYARVGSRNNARRHASNNSRVLRVWSNDLLAATRSGVPSADAFRVKYELVRVPPHTPMRALISAHAKSLLEVQKPEVAEAMRSTLSQALCPEIVNLTLAYAGIHSLHSNVDSVYVDAKLGDALRS